MNKTENIKRKGKNVIWWYVLCILAVLLPFTGSQDMAYAKTGYTDHAHSWSAAEDCGGCKAKSGYNDCSTCSHTGKVTCEVCGGEGYTYFDGIISETINGITYKYRKYTSPCSACGGEGRAYGDYWTTSYASGEPDYRIPKDSSYKKGSGKISCTKCGGDGALSSQCVRCNGKGTNYKCTNDVCTLVNKDHGSSGYNNWADEYNNGNANGSTDWLTSAMYTVCYRTENKYTIKFDANGGTGTMNSMTGCLYDNEYTLTANAFTKSGYTFLGWSTSKTAAAPVYVNREKVSKLSATNGATVTLYAVWGSKATTVTFDRNDGSGATLQQMFVVGQTGNRFGYNTDGTPKWEQTGQFGSWTRSGYRLLGWAFEADATEKKYAVYSTVTDNWVSTNSPEVTLYAVWEPISYVIRYDSGGGTGTMEDTPVTFGISTATRENAFTKEGYAFGGWTAYRESDGRWYYAKENGAGDAWYKEGEQPEGSKKYVYSDKQSVAKSSAVDGDIVIFHAVWVPKEYSITFHGNGGTGGPGSMTQTFAAEVSGVGGSIPVRDGYTFQGWYTATDGGKQVFNRSGNAVSDGTYISDGKWMYAGNVTLYARWGMDSYLVTYNPNGGRTSVTELSFSSGDEVELSFKAEKDGYTFVGWNTDPDAAAGLKSFQMPDQEVTLYAVYTIEVSDVANHDYPDYEKVTEDEVYLVVWQKGNTAKSKMYPLAYTDDSGIMLYGYTLPETSISSFVSGMSAYCYQIIAFDNAGNSAVLYEGSSDGTKPEEDFPVPEKYVQTVEHYRYDAVSGEWIWFQTTSSEPIIYGETFIPLHVTPPVGYKKGNIDAAYVVTGAKTSCAYYEPEEYVLSFDANGGSVTPGSKNIRYGELYGDLPTPVRKGYTSLGWFTQREGGTQITSSMKYEAAGNSTLYAHWSVNSYPVVYDYRTNGGTSASLETAQTAYGAAVPLSVTANKAGWTFIGWNTDPDATTKLDSLIMGDQGVTLYAIYKKNITATFIDGENRNKRTETVTIYNRAVSCDMPVPAVTGIVGWTSLGWSLDTKADAVCVTSGSARYEMTGNLTFYACYVKEVTLSYDTNGAAQQIDSSTAEQYFNAGGNRKDPVFVIANAPNLAEHSFVSWGETVNGMFGNSYLPGASVTVSKDTVLTARWDKIPQIEAYDRYFTLEEAINGEITQDRLLEKVTAADKEDGVLVNGVDVVVDDYDASDFTREGEITITIQATDSFGNEVEKSITIHIVNTEAKKSNRVRFVRFISAEFFADASGNLIVPEAGGVESTSVWRNTESYKTLLARVLSNTKSNEEYKTIEYLGTSTQIKVAGSGEWTYMEETWVFTREDIEEVKTFVDDHGYGNIKTPNALQMFLELFSACRTTE